MMQTAGSPSRGAFRIALILLVAGTAGAEVRESTDGLFQDRPCAERETVPPGAAGEACFFTSKDDPDVERILDILSSIMNDGGKREETVLDPEILRIEEYVRKNSSRLNLGKIYRSREIPWQRGPDGGCRYLTTFVYRTDGRYRIALNVREPGPEEPFEVEGELALCSSEEDKSYVYKMRQRTTLPPMKLTGFLALAESLLVWIQPPTEAAQTRDGGPVPISSGADERILARLEACIPRTFKVLRSIFQISDIATVQVASSPGSTPLVRYHPVITFNESAMREQYPCLAGWVRRSRKGVSFSFRLDDKTGILFQASYREGRLVLEGLLGGEDIYHWNEQGHSMDRDPLNIMDVVEHEIRSTTSFSSSLYGMTLALRDFRTLTRLSRDGETGRTTAEVMDKGDLVLPAPVRVLFGSSINRFFDLLFTRDPELGPLGAGEFLSPTGERDLAMMESSVALKIYDSGLIRFLLWMNDRLGGLAGGDEEDLEREIEEIQASLFSAFQCDLRDGLNSTRRRGEERQGGSGGREQ